MNIHRIALLMATVLAVMVLGAGAASAESGEGGDAAPLKAKIALRSTGINPGAKGQVELQLFVHDAGANDLMAKANAQGLTPKAAYSLCVAGTFVDNGLAIGGQLQLEDNTLVSLTSLSGLAVTINQGTGCGGAAVLQGTIP